MIPEKWVLTTDAHRVEIVDDMQGDWRATVVNLRTLAREVRHFSRWYDRPGLSLLRATAAMRREFGIVGKYREAHHAVA